MVDPWEALGVLLTGAGLVGFGGVFAWLARTPDILRPLLRTSPWLVMGKGHLLTDAEVDEVWRTRIRPVWLFVLAGRLVQVAGAGVIVLAILHLTVWTSPIGSGSR